MSKERICLISLGCPKNLVDSEVTLGLLSKEGYEITSEPAAARIIVINTCAFIRDAVQEAINTILEYSHFKNEGSCRLLVVTGCLPQRYGRDLEAELPEVDLFLGTGAFQKLPRLLAKGWSRKSHLSGKSFLPGEATPRILSTPSATAYLKIAEGCSRACTFCTVPSIRGPYRSRSPRAILREAQSLAARGVRELILVGQDTTLYGRDRADGADLETLLRALAKTAGLRWIRLLYAYPESQTLTDRLLGLMAEEKKICPYIDLPIQHIDDTILRRMGRKTRGKEIRELLGRIRTHLPGASLRTSLIVGFPGETEEQFGTLLDFIEEVRFDHLGVFKYSPEEGTPAARLPGAVPEEVKEERLGLLMEAQEKISSEKYQALVGSRKVVLIEGPASDRKGYLRGRLQTQAPEIDGGVLLKGKAGPGDWVEAEITGALPFDLLGKVRTIL
jgi:ribosomal protein S12 methylthiotransferase